MVHGKNKGIGQEEYGQGRQKRYPELLILEPPVDKGDIILDVGFLFFLFPAEGIVPDQGGKKGNNADPQEVGPPEDDDILYGVDLYDHDGEGEHHEPQTDKKG
jgi:hypothetical protein